MKKTLLFIAVFMLSFSVLAVDPSVVYIAYTGQAPTVDGTIDAVWDIAPAFTPTVIMNAEFPSDGLEGNGTTPINTPAGQWRAMYDENNLYFLVQVNDANPVNNGPVIGGNVSYWAADGVEIFLSRANGVDQK